MADLGNIGGLPTGQIVAVVQAGATTTGTAKSYEFDIESAPDGHDHTLALCTVGASAVPTTVTANLEASFDGAVTWQIYAASVALVATTVSTVFIKNVVAGPIYRVNITAVTIGSAVTFTVYGVVN